MCVYVCAVCMHVCVWLHISVYVGIDQRRSISGLFYHSPSYFLETKSVIEPGGVVATEILLAYSLHSTGVLGLFGQGQLFNV